MPDRRDLPGLIENSPDKIKKSSCKMQDDFFVIDFYGQIKQGSEDPAGSIKLAA